MKYTWKKFEYSSGQNKLVLKFQHHPISFLLFILILYGFSAANDELDSLAGQAVKISLVKLDNSVKDISDTSQFPTYGTKDLKWKVDGSEKWTSGFYPGCLWLAFELSGNQKFETWARQWTASIEREKNNTETHDLGFKFMCTYENGLRLGSGAAYGDYKEILLSAASTLSKRYNPKVGCLRSNWDREKIKNSFPVIIDIMANLNLLFWASKNGGPGYYKDYALNHAKRTCRDFVRPDSGTYHIVRYNKNTGDIINKGTLQGAGDETTWSRGHAWMIYGLVETYAYTNDEYILDMALKIADFFIKHLPEDQVSPWDFDSDIDYRDVSATCIVTSALFKLAGMPIGTALQKKFRKQAESMLTSLCRTPYFIKSTVSNCILDHSVHYLTIDSNVDVPAIFADYYFLEALVRYKYDNK
jgi:unsaturated chondroitin disaccharide hydrolase